MANFEFKMDKKTYNYLTGDYINGKFMTFGELFETFMKDAIPSIFEDNIDADKINDYLETDEGTLHEKLLLSSMNRNELNLASAMCNIRELILAANSLGITLGFGAEFIISERKLRNKIQISIDNASVLQYGNRIFEIAAEVVDLMKKWIGLLNSYGTHLYGANDAVYIRSAQYNIYGIKVTFIKNN